MSALQERQQNNTGKKDVVVETESVLTAGPQEPSLPMVGRGRGASLMGEALGALAWWAPCASLREGPKEHVVTAWHPVFPRAAGAIAQAEDSPWPGCAPSRRPLADICRAHRVILPPSSPPNLCTLGWAALIFKVDKNHKPYLGRIRGAAGFLVDGV